MFPRGSLGILLSLQTNFPKSNRYNAIFNRQCEDSHTDPHMYRFNKTKMLMRNVNKIKINQQFDNVCPGTISYDGPTTSG